MASGAKITTTTTTAAASSSEINQRASSPFRFLKCHAAAAGEVAVLQCDQMVKLFFNIWPFTTMKI